MNPPGAHPADAAASGFRCILCGECCRGSQKVWLNPADMDRLSAHLGIAGPEELQKRRVVVMESAEHGVPRPRIRFVPTPAGRSCPFLVNDLGEDGLLRGRCALHYTGAKPLVCRLAPLSREVDIDDGRESWSEVPPVTGCPGWAVNPPPPDGRPVAPPPLEAALREDLDGETRYFRVLSAGLNICR